MNEASPLKSDVSYIVFEEKYASDFASINYQWLADYFDIEPQDKVVLENPVGEVIDKGGQIFFAVVEGKAVGTVALILKEPGTFELVKMGVLSAYKGLKIGKGLIQSAIDYARKLGMNKIVLETNSKLLPAISLYQKAGFRIIEPDPNTKYKRCDLWMELKL
ncbi:MAG: GNAT family N-acetyltransferase [Cyclobacteriaceae bacterium]